MARAVEVLAAVAADRVVPVALAPADRVALAGEDLDKVDRAAVDLADRVAPVDRADPAVIVMGDREVPAVKVDQGADREALVAVGRMKRSTKS